jgi:hypothetical protein
MGSTRETLFEPLPPPPVAPDLSAESDGGIVCELRRVWKNLDIGRQTVECNWPTCAAKQAELERICRMQAVIVEAGKRLKARVCQTPCEAGEAGF